MTVERSVAAAIRRILWGTVIIVADVRVGGFDLVVDAVGAALIVWAVVDIHRRFPRPRLESRLMLVAAAVTFGGGASDLVATASAEVTGGRFTLWAAVVSAAQVFGSWALATVFAANLDPSIGARWAETARALRLWALPFAVVVVLLAAVDLAQGLFLLLVIPILYAMALHLVALGRTVQTN